MGKYYISENNQILGAYTLDELGSILFTPNSLAWKKGMNEWKKASEIEDLKLLLEQKKKNTPPPFKNDYELFFTEPNDTGRVEIIDNEQNERKFRFPFIDKLISPIYMVVFIVILILISIGIYLMTIVTANRIPLTDIERHLLYQKEKGRKSIEEYELLLRKNPNSCEAYYLLAQINFYLDSKNIDDVKIKLLKSLELKPSFFYSNMLLAQMYYNEKNLAEAKNLVTKAQEIKENDLVLKDLVDKIERKENELIKEERLLEEELLFENQKKSLSGDYYLDESIYSRSGHIYLKAHLIVKERDGNFSCTIYHRGVLPNGEVIISNQTAYLDEIIAVDSQKLEGIIRYSDGHTGNFKWDGISRFLISTLKTSLFPDNPEFATYKKVE